MKYHLRSRLSRACFIPLASLVLVPSCQPVGIVDQVSFNRPSLNFSAQGARTIDCALPGQLETGRSNGSTITAGGCASCR